jgi:hypothetical protein
MGDARLSGGPAAPDELGARVGVPRSRRPRYGPAMPRTGLAAHRRVVPSFSVPCVSSLRRLAAPGDALRFGRAGPVASSWHLVTRALERLWAESLRTRRHCIQTYQYEQCVMRLHCMPIAHAKNLYSANFVSVGSSSGNVKGRMLISADRDS